MLVVFALLVAWIVVRHNKEGRPTCRTTSCSRFGIGSTQRASHHRRAGRKTVCARNDLDVAAAEINRFHNNPSLTVMLEPLICTMPFGPARIHSAARTRSAQCGALAFPLQSFSAVVVADHPANTPLETRHVRQRAKIPREGQREHRSSEGQKYVAQPRFAATPE